METLLKHFDDHICIFRSEKSKCKWTHSKDRATWVVDKWHKDRGETGRGDGAKIEWKLSEVFNVC